MDSTNTMNTPTKPNDGGPAFPATARLIRYNPETGTKDVEPITQGGMTLLAYFAGQALTGILPATTNAHLHHSAQTPPDDIIAKWAVGAADALIAELDK